MLILFTSEENQKAEKEKLIHIFENGLPLFHVRKPGITEESLKCWLSQFNEKYLQKMVLHQHHHLTEIFPVKGIHLKESFRTEKKDLADFIKRFQSKGLTVSSSFHDLETLEKETSEFDYVFLSPVFTSVSKKEYEGKAFNVKSLPQRIIALGGIKPDNIAKAKILGYKGIAVLGTVWFAKNKHKAFNQIYDEYKNVFKS